MLWYIIRRLMAIVGVLLAASFIVYWLTAISGDPLLDLKGSNSPNRNELIERRTEMLRLNDPIIVRWVDWLFGFVFRGDLGVSYSRGDQAVTSALMTASWSTIQLVTWATVIAAILGIGIGMITALRQYSGLDYTVTLISFVFYSLPIFWFAVLLKEFGAIRLNQFIDNPLVPWWGYILVGLIIGVLAGSVAGGDLRRRLLVGLIGALASGGLLFFLVVTGWFQRPALGIPGVILLGAAISIVTVLLSNGLQNKRALAAAGSIVLFCAAMWYPMLYGLFTQVGGRSPLMTPLLLVGLFIVFTLLGVLSGWLWGKDDKKSLMRTGGIVGFLTFGVIVIDMMMTVLPFYKRAIPLGSGFIATIGATTPGFGDRDMWMQMLDTFAHLLLPTIALSIVSVAAWTRYTRASLLEVLNHDYVRTARAKGLTERTVVMRHAFRNMLIPIVTIIAFDIGGLLGGAVITETVFAWKGMGSLFVDGLRAVDVNLVMGFFLLVGALTIFFNLVADIAYAYLDPRIRLK